MIRRPPNSPLFPTMTLSRPPEAHMEGLRAEAFARLRAYRERPPADRVPRYLLQLREDQKYAIVVDTHRSRLYLYQNEDRKSTRLNSSHGYISYAVFCLKKKK